MALHVVILAAGLGKRMQSHTPKVLHKLGGEPMLVRVITTAQKLAPAAIHVIYGHGGEHIRQTLGHLEVNWVLQVQQLGTGHAVMQALPQIPDEAHILVLSGDVPLIQTNTLQTLLNSFLSSQALSLLVARVADPTGLGRIIRNQAGIIQAIIEEKEADEQQRQINEIYSGICCGKASDFKRWLPQLSHNNSQNEYYLTAIIHLAVKEHHLIQSLVVPHLFEIQGVNNRLQLQQLERLWQQHQAQELLIAGVAIADAQRIDIRGELNCGQDVFIDINCIFTGQVTLGDHCTIGPNCSLTEVTLGNNCHIKANSVLENCHLAEDCEIGPFARLRPGTKLAKGCKIGNFVETKNAVFAQACKANHLSYLGDVSLGKGVNIGAGTITCNYDGANKHQTIIEEGVFVGSNTQLIAPVTLGAYATIGAGSTIRKNVPAGELTLSENKQKTIKGWKRPVKSHKTE